MVLSLSLANQALADYVWYNWEGHKYAQTNTSGSWTDCEAEAIAAGGHLVTINNFEEEMWFESMEMWNAPFWIGFYQAPNAFEPDAGWSWASGEPISYTNWLLGYPTEMWYGDADYAVGNFQMTPSYWVAEPTYSKYYGIIEINTFKGAPVPEPATMLLLGTGIAGLAGSRFRRKKQ